MSKPIAKKLSVLTLVFCYLFYSIVILHPISAKADIVDLYGQILVSDVGTAPSIANANTSRTLAVSTTGIIYAVYHCNEGIRVAKSTNQGMSFQPSVLVYNQNYETEIAVSTTGVVYVTWVENGNIRLSKSTDQAATFSAPVNVGTGTTSVHMATDGNYLYFIDRPGSRFYRSTDAGLTFSGFSTNTVYVFADVHVDPVTHTVIIQADNPAICYYLSNDFGATFGSPITTNGWVNYSVGTIGSNASNSYLVIGGYSTMGCRIKIGDSTVTNLSLPSCITAQGRSISADAYGNMVCGFINGGNVYLQASNDLGSTFGPSVLVEAATMANASINPTNGNVLFLYQSGNQVFFKVFNNMLQGYSINVSKSSLYFSIDSGSVAQDVTLSNSSDGSIAINSITVDGDFTVDRTAVGSSLSAGQSAVIHVACRHSIPGTNTGSVVINYGSPAQQKVILLTSDTHTAPIGLTGVAPAYYGDNDGKITGVDSSMEYKTSTASSYTAINGSEITNLSAGDYNVRFKSQNGSQPSPDTIVTVPQGKNRDQNAPTTPTGVAPTYYGESDGKITGVDSSMEYKASTASSYTAIIGNEIDSLSAGDYNVRYKAKTGYNASPDIIVAIVQGKNRDQNAPTTPAGAAPTYYGDSDGKITGVDSSMEYKASTASSYTVIIDSEINSLSAGDYNVRYKAKTGYNASPDTTITIAQGRNRDQNAPTTPTGVVPTYYGDSDGKITGVDSSMEYKASTASSYTAITGSEITLLPVGDYNVRYKAKTGYNASPDTVVAIAQGKNRDQNAPTKPTGVAPTYYGNSDGKITGVDSSMEYKASTASSYTAIIGSEITSLSTGDYNVRYKSKTGYNASPDIIVAIAQGKNRDQTAPSGLTGVAPTFYGNIDGKITGLTEDMEYKLSTASEWTRASKPEITNLPAGTYQIRYAAKLGVNASAIINIIIPQAASGNPSAHSQTQIPNWTIIAAIVSISLLALFGIIFAVRKKHGLK